MLLDKKEIVKFETKQYLQSQIGYRRQKFYKI